MVTATSEGDPVIAIGGEVPIRDRLKKTHQSLDATSLMKAATKRSFEIVSPEQVGEVLGNAIRVAEGGRPGAVFISLPQDVGLADYHGNVDANWGKILPIGPAASSATREALDILKTSKRPIAILGMQSSPKHSSDALIRFFKKSGIPYVSTFQGIIIISLSIIIISGGGAWVGVASGAIYAGRIGISLL